jgi:myotubularin-related protein 1/2
MSDTTDKVPEVADPLQAALLEAENLMESLGGNGSFAIDSDEELEVISENELLHPLHEAFLKVPDEKSRNINDNLVNGVTTAVERRNDYSGTASLQGVTTTSFPPPQPSSIIPMFGNDTSLQSFTVSSATPSLDVIKASTSRFASNLANMAQRAANQVSTAVGTPTAQAASVSGFMPSNQVHSFQQPINYPSPANPTAVVSNQQQLPELDAEQKTILVQSHVGDLIPGERIIMFLQNVQHVSDSTGFQYNNDSSTALWCCAMTFYRLLLFSTHPIQAPTKPDDWNSSCWPKNPQSILQIPLSNIDKIEKSVFTATTAVSGFGSMNIGTVSPNLSNTLSTTTIMGLIIHDKLNGRQIRFTTQAYSDTNRAYEALHTYSFPGRRNLGYLFAFESKREQVIASIETDAAGNKKVLLPPLKKRFDAVPEFQRQFTNASFVEDQGPWSIWNMTNSSYQLCMSYPSILVGPISLDESIQTDKSRIVRHCAAFRSEQRLPALTWCGIGGSSIWRCSQPKVGLQGNRSSADEQYLKHIMECAASARSILNHDSIKLSLPPRSILVQLTGTPDLTNWMPNNIGLKILDLRPRSSAMANRTGGYGYENTSHYSGCSLQFCNIGNIHAVRDAYQKLSQVCLSTAASDLHFASQIEDTKWLSHIRLIWSAAWEAAYWVQVHKLPVLVHCSHGWDRTSQVVALAQILVDPYYRTMYGFSCLIEKDFMSFGHPFHLRCGHGEGRDGASNASSTNGGNGPTIDEGQISPIFLQFLDCVYQVVRLYPEAFEFNTKYLLLLSEHVYSARFGNFLCDSEREREIIAGIRQRTHSVWDYLDELRSDVVNDQYSPATCGAGALLMPLPALLRNIVLWTDRHCMHSPKPTMRWLPDDIERPIHPRNNDQPSDLFTEQEMYQLLYSLPKQRSKEENASNAPVANLDAPAPNVSNGDESISNVNEVLTA